MDKTFETLVKQLEDNALLLKSGKLSLDEITNVYKNSIEIYKEAEKLLNDTKQRIEIYKPETGKVEEFDEL